jgi:coenzyme F420-reducing hydrogenase delta subunit
MAPPKSNKNKNKKSGKKSSVFEPKILAFCCNWCSYAGADLAGVSRVQYPTNVRIIRIMCTGRLEPSHILTAFENGGADGVVVSGCHPGDCHYISGNLRAEEMIKQLKKLLDIIGFKSERLRLQWVSASEGQLFGEYITEFVELIKKLGPSPLEKTETNSTSSPSLSTKNTDSSKVNGKIKTKVKAVVSG